MKTTLAQVTGRTGFEVLGHLERDAEVPVLDGLQAQGDVLIIPQAITALRPLAGGAAQPVPAAGIPVVAAAGGGHEHRLFAGQPGTVTFTPASRGGQDIGLLECTASAYLLHPEHGAAGIAPGGYLIRRQREQAAQERLVAD